MWDGYFLTRILLRFFLLFVPTQQQPLRAPLALQARTYHVQGIDVSGSTLWLSSVDRTTRRGLLFSFDMATGRLLGSVEIQQGILYHAGGIALDGRSLWVPVAEYRSAGRSVIQERDRDTLELKSEFPVYDHIGAVAVVPEGILGVNWDAREFYLWTRQGRLLRRFRNRTGVRIQDMKFTAGTVVAAGPAALHLGTVVWLAWPSLEVLYCMQTGLSDSGVPYAHEGFTQDGQALYFVPEDEPSRLFVFAVPEQAPR